MRNISVDQASKRSHGTEITLRKHPHATYFIIKAVKIEIV